LQPVSHRTLSGFPSNHKAALDHLFVQVVGTLSVEGLITMQRMTLDGTKIKASPQVPLMESNSALRRLAYEAAELNRPPFSRGYVVAIKAELFSCKHVSNSPMASPRGR
jgi:hypothetical protein